MLIGLSRNGHGRSSAVSSRAAKPTRAASKSVMAWHPSALRGGGTLPRVSKPAAVSPSVETVLTRVALFAGLGRVERAFLGVATTLSRRRRAGNVTQLENEAYLGATLAHALERLPEDRRGPVMDACVLDDVSDDALRALFGDAADGVRADLAVIGIRTDAPSRAGVRSL